MAFTTIASHAGGNLWPSDWGASGTLGIICSRDFVADDGRSFQQGNGLSLTNEFVTTTTITVASSIPTYGPFALPKTDASSPIDVRYTGVIFDANGVQRDWLFSGFDLVTSLGSSISFLMWWNDNQQRRRHQLDTTPSTTQMNLAITAAIDSAALDQDYVIGDYASFAAAITALTAGGGTLVINAATTCTTNTTVPANVILRFTGQGSITISNSVTLTLASRPEVDGEARQVFFNALSGQGTVVLPSSVEAVPDWWVTNTTLGTTVMTAGVLAALNSGAATLRNDSNYRVGLLTIPSSVHRIYGVGTFTQNAAGADILSGTGITGITIEGLTFQGVTGNFLESSNNAIQLTSCSQVRILNNKFNGMRYFAARATSSSDVVISGNSLTNWSVGLQFQGVTDGDISNNKLGPPQYTGFTVGIGLDSGVRSSNVTITGNRVKSLTNGQAIMVHDGRNVAISSNTLDDVMVGITVNPFVAGDVVRDIAITGNALTGTSTAGAGAGIQNSGIQIVGDDGVGAHAGHVSNVTAVGNTIKNFNVIGDIFSQGGISVGYADNVILDANIIEDCVASGIALSNANTGLVIGKNNIKNVVAATDTSRAGIIATISGPHTGRIEGNWIDGATDGMRFSMSSPGLLIGPNDISNVTNVYLNPSNANFGTTALATTTPLNISASLAAATLSTYTPTQASTLNATTLPQPNKKWTLIITTSGTSSFVITFGTNFKSTGTLATGTVSGKVFVLEFQSDGTSLNEVSRTTAM